ncbi:hypothetical protein J6595_00555 [Jiella sp. KSK16Y-1]|uniref:Uncharacterized protein n=2 Tax=Jiella mangrovi TaxID=2821407 RepID=A0ABS4BC06_9HYPH|nr:hypothetical protein [Jiella mangrovi]
MTYQFNSVGSPAADHTQGSAASSPSTRRSSAAPEELRASLAGASRSPAITPSYIEELKAKAEERVANANAIRSRMQLEGLAAKASTDLIAAATSSDGSEASAAAGPASVAAAQNAYRNGGAF